VRATRNVLPGVREGDRRERGTVRILARRFSVSHDCTCAAIEAERAVRVSGVEKPAQRVSAEVWWRRSSGSRLAPHAYSENASSPFRAERVDCNDRQVTVTSGVDSVMASWRARALTEAALQCRFDRSMLGSVARLPNRRASFY
jgi:hypothetical protein